MNLRLSALYGLSYIHTFADTDRLFLNRLLIPVFLLNILLGPIKYGNLRKSVKYEYLQVLVFRDQIIQIFSDAHRIWKTYSNRIL